ncbi:hypothetical protein [Actinotalea sp. Marseille-Q4924]|uniref:hypothetical protein n=1 Tax=Actinotalea sp. Marseille-Q4924 TaxID=2866571 RepID=UPI001CE42A56|nr:hypothetical protein [Actinotalea sp. Marseille-Q4924]
MQIDKAQILEFLKSQGQGDKAEQADKELPGTVDTDRDRGLLDKLGIDVQSLLGSLGGNLGGLGGKLGL